MAKPSGKKPGLTEKQRRFIPEYLIDMNATQAAIRAGYSRRSAEVEGCRLLRNAKVAAEIAKARAEWAQRTEITQDRVLKELAKLGFANMLDYMRPGADGDPSLDFSALTRDQAAALVEVTVEDFKDGRGEEGRDVRKIKFKLADKRAALVDIGKHLGMFVDKHEITGKDGGPVASVTIATDDPIEAAKVYQRMIAGG